MGIEEPLGDLSLANARPLPFSVADRSLCPPMRGSRQSTIEPRRHACASSFACRRPFPWKHKLSNQLAILEVTLFDTRRSFPPTRRIWDTLRLTFLFFLRDAARHAFPVFFSWPMGMVLFLPSLLRTATPFRGQNSIPH